ncbi:hypothetical protein FNF27_00775 [Cafeteria roenbergensis]|uniref:Metallo-beta-lactamase domain-containing protein n=1 Tax=Cafeteria roenbergensis TaxID=33653 RepID=A0A5A8EIB2_CAFRO|nr:hypothetical protein FNF27_00775 [Cafeteria roenbergensis]
MADSISRYEATGNVGLVLGVAYVCILLAATYKSIGQCTWPAGVRWFFGGCGLMGESASSPAREAGDEGGTEDGGRDEDESDLPMLVNLSILFLAAVRSVAFLSLGILSAFTLHNATTGDDDVLPASSQAVELYSVTTQALIAAGDGVFVSLYLLLTGLWVEAQSALRRHLYDPAALRGCWITAWLAVNSTLYALQIALFVALFASGDVAGRTALLFTVYAVTALVSFLLPVIVVVACVCTRSAFRGFPSLRSEALQERSRILSVTLALWSLGRLAWGVKGVADAAGIGDLVSGSSGSLRFALTTAGVFIVGELLPAGQALFGMGLGSDRALGVARDADAAPAGHGAAAALSGSSSRGGGTPRVMASGAAQAAVQRLSKGVIRIMGHNPGPMTLDGTCTYLLGTGAKRILVDTGDGTPAWRESLQAVLAAEQCSVSVCLLTHHHYDHVGGVADVLRVCEGALIFKAPDSGAPTKWPALDDGSLPEVCNISDGDTFGVEGAAVSAVATPGHTPDSLSFLVDGEGVLPWGAGRAALVGDCVLGSGTGVITDLAALLASLEALAAREPAALYCGHGPPVVGEAGEDSAAVAKLSELAAHRRARAEQVLAALPAEGEGLTAVEAASRVYEAAGMGHVLADSMLAKAAAFQTLVALRYLLSRGQCCRLSGPEAGAAAEAVPEGSISAADWAEAAEARWVSSADRA